MSSPNREHWSNRFMFILAAAGSAIGLGNIWKFPYIAGENGGGAFVIVYLIAIAAVGVPILIAEIFIGQTSQANAVTAFEKVHPKGKNWTWVGLMGVIAGFMIVSFYSVVGGWILDFEFRSLMGEFANKSDEEIKGTLGSLFGDPKRMLIWHFIFMGGTIAIVYGGIKKGIERWSRILMPGLGVLLVILLVRALSLDGFGKAVEFLFAPDFSKLTPASVLTAVGHAFFTLSLGMGCMLTYGSYLKKNENLIKTAVTVAALDTIIALIAGLVIFSVVFTFNFEPGQGPGLIFATLPMLLMKLPGGNLVAIIFFMLVAFAAFTSAVSLLEVVVTYCDEKFEWPRKRSTLIVGSIVFLLGVPCALSFNLMADFKILGLNFFDIMDKTSSNIMLPLGGALIALFFGWVMGEKAVKKVTQGLPDFAGVGLLWTARIVSPAAVFWVLGDFLIGLI